MFRLRLRGPPSITPRDIGYRISETDFI